MNRAELWEVRLAVDAAADHCRETGCPAGDAVALVCEMHGIDDPIDRRVVGEAVPLRLGLEAQGVAA